MSVDRSLQQLALQLASQHRTCPEDAILFSENPDSELNAHLKSCLACRDRKKNHPAGTPDMQEAFRVLKSRFSPPSPGEPVPGQIWKLMRRIAGWGPNNRYFNPPLVLVLQKESQSGEFRVSQVYSDDLLMGPDDVWLGNGLGFAQPWNIYAVNRRDLEMQLAAVDNGILLEFNPQRLSLPRELPSDPIIRFFRQMEKEVGEVITLRSSEQCALDTLKNWLADTRKLADSLTERIKGWVWPDNYEEVWGFLAAARPEVLPLAADEGDTRHDINILQLCNGIPPSITRQSCAISRWGTDADGLLIRGFLPESTRHPRNLFAHWVEAGRQTVSADHVEFDQDTGAFKLRFSSLNEQINNLDSLQLAVVTLA